MQTVLSAVLPDVPRAAVIWLSLLAVVAVAFAALLVRPGRFRFDASTRIRRAAMPSDLERSQEERELTRYAGEVGVAAERAGATAQRLRTEWLTAQDEVEAAWTAYEAAEAGVRRLATAAAMPLPRTARTPAEYADRERYLHRAALTAYWQRELSVEQLSDIFAHRGWDPRRHPVEQELMLRQAVRDHLFARHQAAREREQEAWRAAERAADAARSLRQEAYAATERRVEEDAPSVLTLLGGPASAIEQTREMPALPTRERTVVARGRAAVPAY
ncbi:hypothetical protein [Micromonospora endolithica]|uniref:AP2/ERF domain-containing protein n=1 Tax=Micromonospora endolithica TaxID=230091 RepID=A0A3A9YYC0_9ACTN|nr:hypothetical protein [Micromonospora endolithica]RKN41132.1 hypothetical protein D7223_25705 [Micromonospora endolithica]TWJ24367.1 hypothetical protein JD76_04517 [Micromonospora endolithica]